MSWSEGVIRSLISAVSSSRLRKGIAHRRDPSYLPPPPLPLPSPLILPQGQNQSKKEHPKVVRLQCLNVQQPEKRRQRSIFNLDLNLIFITQAKEAHHEKWYVKVDNTAILRNAKAKYTRNDRDLKKQKNKQTNNNEDVTTRNMVTWRFSLLASKSIILDIAFDTDPRIQVIGGCPLVSFVKKNLLSRHWKYARQIF